MGPELILAITTIVHEGTSILLKIGERVNEAGKFRTKCTLLYEDAALLLKLLENNKDGVDGLQILDNFKATLKEIESFVDECANWGALRVGSEVFLKHKFPALREKTRALIEKFIFEVEIETLARERAGFADVTKTQHIILQNQNVAIQSLAIVRKYITEENLRRSAKASTRTEVHRRVKCDFKDNDKRLKLVLKEELDVVGRKSQVGRGTLEGVGAVVCTKIEESPHTEGYLEVYRNIQYAAGVQLFYGTLDTERDIYAVMEDLESEVTLHDTLLDKSFDLSNFEKVGIISDLCKTVAWFHKSQICLKTLSDVTVVLKKTGPTKWSPVLTGLERSRLFLVKTSRDAYDCRYEAPEFQNMGEHSWSTDIWSLGIVIWQIVSGLFPFDEAKSVDPSTETASHIRTALQASKLPGVTTTIDSQLLAILPVIRKCWRRRGDLRPTAEDVSRTLQNIYIQQSSKPLSLNSVPVNETESESPRAEFMHKIKLARKENPPGTKPPLKIPKDSLIDGGEFLDLYYEDDNWDSIKSYIAVAVFFWDLANSAVDEISTSQFGAQDRTERRLMLALEHLFSAANSGYTEAYQEIWRAEGDLARLYRTRHEVLYPAGKLLMANRSS